MSDGSVESCRPRRQHAEDLTARSDGTWVYTMCGHLLPAGFVFHPRSERHRVSCSNCLRAKAFKGYGYAEE